MMRKLSLALLLIVVCGARFAEAQSCTISATGIAFGNYTGTTIDVTGTVSVKCTGKGNTTYDVGLNAGAGSGATVTNRSMTGSAPPLLGYGLYSDAGYSVNWGDSAATNWVPKVGGGGGTDTFTVHAQLPAAQYPTLGSYFDTITATVYIGGVSYATTTFSVTATVQKDCIVSATALVFGNYTGAVNNATSTVTVTCTNTAPYTVGLSAGLASGATVTTRKMQDGALLLPYALYSNSGMNINWGNTSGSWVSGTGSGYAQPLTVYGQIAAGQYPTPGSYTDTITATVTY
jgi:spore coat protein U-like protein